MGRRIAWEVGGHDTKAQGMQLWKAIRLSIAFPLMACSKWMHCNVCRLRTSL
jgi:hypothetical protein